MSEVDYRHIGDLMKVIEGSAGHPGKFNAIATAALAELADINAELAKEQADAKKAAEEEAAKQAALAAEKAKAQEAAQANAPKSVPATDLTDSPSRRL